MNTSDESTAHAVDSPSATSPQPEPPAAVFCRTPWPSCWWA
ncbi:hypothetical protein NKH77_51045 [Streptomyces sp. M19]